MNKLIEQLIYSFGLNLSFYNVKKEILLLKDYLPESFKNRVVTDIGCGDGKVTIELAKVLKPRKLVCVDSSTSLINSAKKKGISASLFDIEKEKVSGDLGVLWGVLHHLKNPEKTLRILAKNFKSLIIRESVNNKRLFELGHKYNTEELKELFRRAKIKTRLFLESKNKSVIILV
jgi:2-polyprenyl-3-methyl-5-hydroxy-6-metoxy-1,4-benzoquinol methylase